jgi:hypothetical protein
MCRDRWASVDGGGEDADVRACSGAACLPAPPAADEADIAALRCSGADGGHRRVAGRQHRVDDNGKPLGDVVGRQ